MKHVYCLFVRLELPNGTCAILTIAKKEASEKKAMGIEEFTQKLAEEIMASSKNPEEAAGMVEQLSAQFNFLASRFKL